MNTVIKTTRKKAKRLANGTQKRPNRGKGQSPKSGSSKLQ